MRKKVVRLDRGPLFQFVIWNLKQRQFFSFVHHSVKDIEFLIAFDCDTVWIKKKTICFLTLLFVSFRFKRTCLIILINTLFLNVTFLWHFKPWLCRLENSEVKVFREVCMVRAPSRPFHNPQSTCWSAPDDSRGGLPCRGKTWSQDDLPFCPGGKCRQKYCSHSPRAVLNYPQHTCRWASIHCPKRISKQAGQSVRNGKDLSTQTEFFLRHVQYNFKYSFWVYFGLVVWSNSF